MYNVLFLDSHHGVFTMLLNVSTFNASLQRAHPSVSIKSSKPHWFHISPETLPNILIFLSGLEAAQNRSPAWPLYSPEFFCWTREGRPLCLCSVWEVVLKEMAGWSYLFLFRSSNCLSASRSSLSVPYKVIVTPLHLIHPYQSINVLKPQCKCNISKHYSSACDIKSFHSTWSKIMIWIKLLLEIIL